jgi:glycosyltransferase involved in cell wall biosynthesis
VDVLAELALRSRVRALSPPGWVVPENWPLDGQIEMVAGETEPESDELALIHLGNNPYHLWLVRWLAGHPKAVVVLHDLVLHHLLVEMAEADGSRQMLEEWLCEAHGEAGGALARARHLGMAGFRDPFLFPARGPFIAAAAGVVVHSYHAWETVVREHPCIPCGRVTLPVADPGTVDRSAARARLRIAEGDVVLMHLGFLTPEKGLQQILAGAAAAVRLGVPVRLLLVGEGRGLVELRRAAQSAGLSDRVVAVGWLPHEHFLEAPAAADLGVVLRTPSAGETSAAAVRFLACGTPVAVGGGRQFLEWPERAAPRITPGPSAAADLTRLLVAAAEGGPEWRQRRIAARAVYLEGHRPESCAVQLLDFLASLE